MPDLGQFINNLMRNYSMNGTWRTNIDMAILEQIADHCIINQYPPHFVMTVVKNLILDALNNHAMVNAYRHQIGSLPLDVVAHNAAKNICRRMYKSQCKLNGYGIH